MSTRSQAKAEEFKAELQIKIQNLIAEFAEGKISREQFNVIYERYSGQMAIADHALLSGNPEAVSIAQTGVSTIAIRDAYMAKAVGLAIYHNKSSVMVDTLGNFDVPSSHVSPVLNDFTKMMESNQLIDRRWEKIGPQQWLFFAAGHYTTVVTLFKNEPSPRQSREIERLHHDFEEANHSYLRQEIVDKNKLVYPFLVFVQKKLKQV